jgi:heterodisulfide reductase subunit A-like polyferredoxin
MSQEIRFQKGDELISFVSSYRPAWTHRGFLPSNTEDKGDRIGVFICRCGGAVSRNVDVDSVAVHISSLDSVTVVRIMDFPCSSKGRLEIKESVRENNLGKFVLAGCSPKTHERLFRKVAAEVGLNPFMFEIANIREQCAFVHDYPEATEKAKTLVEVAVSKCRLLFPAPFRQIPVSSKRVIVVGNGFSAIVAASLAIEQGLEAVLIESGTNLEESGSKAIERGATPEYINGILTNLKLNPLVRILFRSNVVDFQGHPGDFRALIETPDGEEDVRCGAAVLALDAVESAPRPDTKEGRIITQSKFRAFLQLHQSYPRRVVMIVHDGSPQEEICGRSCYVDALANALMLREASPSADITIIGKEVRTYGMCELDYRRAQECGIRFVRSDVEPVIERDTEMRVLVKDAYSDLTLSLPADIVVLSEQVKPQNTDVLARVFRVAIDKNGYFRRTQVKLKPVATLREGVFLCGSAAGPRLLSEELLEASAAASRAVSLLSQPYIEIGGAVAEIEPKKCSVCLTCIRSCPYTAPFINKEGKAEVDIQTCQGCGICVGICPSKAIQIYKYTDAQIRAQSSASISGGGR